MGNQTATDQKHKKKQKQRDKKSQSVNELDGLQKENEEKIKEYIHFINQRKQQYTSNYPKDQSDHKLNTGPQVTPAYPLSPQVWLDEARKLLHHDIHDPKVKKTQTMVLLNDFLQQLDYSGFIRSFSNKCYLEYLAKLEVQPLGFKQRSAQTEVSQDKVKDLLRDFFSNNGLTQIADSQPLKTKSQGSLDLLQSLNIQDQMKQTQKDRRKKWLIQKQLSIEKEITQKDHLIMCTIDQFQKILL